MTPSEITALRIRLGLRVGKFAALVGCGENQIWRWERGITQPSPAYRRVLENIERREE